MNGRGIVPYLARVRLTVALAVALLGYAFFRAGVSWMGSEKASTLSAPQSPPLAIKSPPRRPGSPSDAPATLIPPTRPDHRPRTVAPRVAAMARVYADVNQNMPRAYWDYDSVNISEAPIAAPPPPLLLRAVLTWRN